jgi:hypothetical protein
MPDVVFSALAGRGGHILRDGGWLGRALMLSSSTSKTSRSARAATAGVFAVGEVRGDPETALFAFNHELQAFGPALDHAIERETGGWPRFTELSNSLPSVVQPE